METYRLKNIAIIILLLLNASLLLLLGYQRLQARRAETDAASQLRELCQAGQLSVDGQVDLNQQPLSPLALTRHSQSEQAIAAYLLGDGAAPSSQGGGIYSYAGEHGSIQFRAGGGFDGSRLTVPVEDIPDFSRQFCRQFGYEDLLFQLTGTSGSVTAVQQVAGVPITGCGLTLRFEEGLLTEVTGAHVSLEDAVSEPSYRMSCITALLRFLDYRSTVGIVCSQVTDVRCVYALQSAGPLRLRPMWRVDTDNYVYFVDCATGEVDRA